MREGLDIVTDIIDDSLPTLPAVQTDNHRHAREAGTRLSKRGYRSFLVAGYYPKKYNKRYLGFIEGLDGGTSEVLYVCLQDLNALPKIDKYFNQSDESCAVFSTDYSTNYILAAKFIQHGMHVRNDNFIVYDSEEDFFRYAGLPPIRSVAPSLEKLGEELCTMFIVKWKTGDFPSPLQRKL
jgi:DNA-binding LacI/PurR family transcriptional regulator